jgi:hypothetical protein
MSAKERRGELGKSLR